MEVAAAGGFLIRGTEGMLDVSEAGVKLFNANSNGWEQVPLRVEAEEIQAIGGRTNAAQVRELITWIEGGPEHRGTRQKGARDCGDHDGSLRIRPTAPRYPPSPTGGGPSTRIDGG